MMAKDKPQFTLSVDVETWMHGRWASGSAKSVWPDSKSAYRAVYGADAPGEDFDRSLAATLDLLERLGIPATFFVLTEMVDLKPQALEGILRRGHEIALHGITHVSNDQFAPEAFREMIGAGRERLQAFSGEGVVGYRAPNLILDSRQLAILEEEGFRYESSICPSRKFFGKFGNMTGAPMLPYHPAKSDLRRPGEMRIVELPLPAFPVIRWPAGTGIMARAVGGWWPQLALAATLRHGYGLFYFHPYEVGEPFALPKQSLYLRLFCRNIGTPFQRFLERYLGSLKDRVAFGYARDVAAYAAQSASSRG
jgi:peptidoglycan/xylan/chitin deacetylase (PgdA/CDA1 family)